MAMHFGYDEHPPNHVHNIKPLVALPSYSISEVPFRWKYSSGSGINQGYWRNPTSEEQYIPVRNVITQVRVNGIFTSWIQPKGTVLILHSHIFDSDDNITNLTMSYELVCFMKDGSTEYKAIEEFDVMPYKLIPGIVSSTNTFLYDKKYFLSDLQPNYSNMAMFNIRIKNVRSTQAGLHNESILNILIYNRVDRKAMNDAIIAAIGT